MDVNNDGVIGLEEFRYNAIQRLATDEIKIVDDAFNALLNVSTKAEIEKVFLNLGAYAWRTHERLENLIKCESKICSIAAN